MPHDRGRGPPRIVRPQVLWTDVGATPRAPVPALVARRRPAVARTQETAGGVAKAPRMLRNTAHAPSDGRMAATQGLERLLLRAGVGVLAADRARCRDCGRTPLIGEEIHLYERGAVVCELCRQLRAEAPASTERVRHSEYGQTVRLRRAA
jgi:hypothetical protein